MPFPESKKAKRKRYYCKNLQKALSNSIENYKKNRAAVKASSSTYRKDMHTVNPEKERAASRRRFKKSYDADFEHSRALSRRSSEKIMAKILSMLGPSLGGV